MNERLKVGLLTKEDKKIKKPCKWKGNVEPKGLSVDGI